MSGPGCPDTVDELVVGPEARPGRTTRSPGPAVRAVVDLLARPVARRGVLGGAAVLAALTLGPGLLSGPPTSETPERQRGGVTSRDAGPAGAWTGPPERPSGNRFVQSPVRLLRLPA